MKQRCSSNDFIVINDNSEKVARCFYVWRRKRGREPTNGETERVCVWEAECLQGGRWHQYNDQNICINTQQKRNMIKRMNAVDKVSIRQPFPLDKLTHLFFSLGTFKIWLQSRRFIIHWLQVVRFVNVVDAAGEQQQQLRRRQHHQQPGVNVIKHFFFITDD